MNVSFETIYINPGMPKYMYSFSNVSIHNDIKFEMYATQDTCRSVNEIFQELVAKRDKELEEAEAAAATAAKEETKEEPQQDTYGYNYYNQPQAKPSGDLTEAAIKLHEERRADPNSKNKPKEETKEFKRPVEDEKDASKDEDDEDDENNANAANIDSAQILISDDYFCKVPIEEKDNKTTFGEDLKKCKHFIFEFLMMKSFGAWIFTKISIYGNDT